MKIRNNKKITDFKKDFHVVYENFVNNVIEKYATENPKKPKKHVESLRTLLLNHSELLLKLQEELKKQEKMDGIDVTPGDDEKIPASINININNIETLENLILPQKSLTTIAKDTKGIVGVLSTINIKQDPKLKEILEILKKTRDNHPEFKYDIDSFKDELNNAKNNTQISSILTRATQWYNKHRNKITNAAEIFKTLLETSQYFINKIN